MYRSTEQRLSSFLFLETVLLPPEMHTIVRLQAPTLASQVTTRLGFESLFDPRLGKPLIKTASQLFLDHEALFGFVGRGDISLLLELDTHRNRRSPWTLAGTLAGQASARLSLQLGEPVAFHSLIYQLPTTELAEEYFCWQQRATRLSAMTEHYLQTLRSRGVELEAARQMMEELNPEDLVEALKENGVDPEQIPAWQREGTGLYRQADGQPLMVDTKLPSDEAFRSLLQTFLP